MVLVKRFISLVVVALIFTLLGGVEQTSNDIKNGKIAIPKVVAYLEEDTYTYKRKRKVKC
jgi:hypothetical protein